MKCRSFLRIANPLLPPPPEAHQPSVPPERECAHGKMRKSIEPKRSSRARISPTSATNSCSSDRGCRSPRRWRVRQPPDTGATPRALASCNTFLVQSRSYRSCAGTIHPSSSYSEGSRGLRGSSLVAQQPDSVFATPQPVFRTLASWRSRCTPYSRIGTPTPRTCAARASLSSFGELHELDVPPLHPAAGDAQTRAYPAITRRKLPIETDTNVTIGGTSRCTIGCAAQASCAASP